MFKRKYIKIEEPSIQDGKRIVFKLSFSLRVKKYFLSDSFYVEYNAPIDHVDKSILNIPAVTTLTPVAWAIGADIYVKELDETYLQSLNKIKSIMKKWYSNFSFSSKINVEKIVPNKFSNEGCALLFSGGIDSTTSYIRHRSRKPQLIPIWGVFISPEQKILWKKFEKKLTEFTGQEKAKVHIIKTNVRRLLNDKQLSVEFGLHWWPRVSHGLTMLGLCAPLTKNGISTVLIGSSGRLEDVKYPWGSTPFVDNNLRWADVKIINDCTEFDRQEKIRYVLKKYLETTGYHPFLTVCNSDARFLSHDLNCGQCEKCLRTITGLVLEDIDPNQCGFKVDSKFFGQLKQSFVNHKLKLSENPATILFGETVRTHGWKEIQTKIPERFNHNLHNSREFFEWFRDFDLTKYGLEMEKRTDLSGLFEILKIRLVGCIAPIWYSLPERIQKSLRKVQMQKAEGAL